MLLPQDINNTYVANIKGQVDEVPGLILNNVYATRARYPNIPGGLETSCGYGCMVDGSDATWTPPNFNKYGNVTFYTDNQTKTFRNDTPSDWFQHCGSPASLLLHLGTLRVLSLVDAVVCPVPR